MADQARQSGAETRPQIMEAATALLEERGAAGLNVSAIMQRAGVTRSTFYRQFEDVYGVAAAMLGAIASELTEDASAWFNDVDAVGNREVIYPNTLQAGRAIKPSITLWGAILDATAYDTTLRHQCNDFGCGDALCSRCRGRGPICRARRCDLSAGGRGDGHGQSGCEQ